MSTKDQAQAASAEQTSMPVTLRLAPDELVKAESFARQDHRTRASFLRVMILRGMADYEKQIESTNA